MTGKKGLYGSSAEGNVMRALTAEFIGVVLLVVPASTAAISGASNTVVAATFGLTLLVLVEILGNISGAHLNPAVTIALTATGSFTKKLAGWYIAVQFAGGAAAAWLLLLMFGSETKKAHFAAPTPAAGVSDIKVLIIELVISFILVFAVMAAATDERVPKESAAIIIGSALTVAILIAGWKTGGAVNPARAIGPKLMAGENNAWWAYITGECLGGVLAAVFFSWLKKADAEALEPEVAG